MHRLLLPEGWLRPSGYAHGVLARGTETLFLSGQVGWNSNRIFETADFVAQVQQALKNIRSILEAGGAGPEHVTRLTWYLTAREHYIDNLREIGVAYRTIMGRHFPAMSVVQVTALVEEEALVEIEATAVK